MARCAYCETETELYESGVPLCIACSQESPERRQARAILLHNLIQATQRAESATEVFSRVTSDIPSGMPHPDGDQRNRNASRDMTAAPDEMMNAHNRLNDS